MKVFLNPCEGDLAYIVPNNNPLEIVQKITNVLMQHGCLHFSVLIGNDFVKIDYLDDFNISSVEVIREAKFDICIDLTERRL